MISVDKVAVSQSALPTSAEGEAQTAEESHEVAGILSEDEQVRFDNIDAELEEIAVRSSAIFEVKLDINSVTLNIVASIKRLWESGGWGVNVFRVENTDLLQIVFARPRNFYRTVPQVRSEEPEGAKPHTVVAREWDGRPLRASKMTTPILVRMPTRGRPEQALAVLQSYRDMAMDVVKIEVIIDEDDTSMNCAEMLQALYDLDCSIFVGKHKNKIDAVNSGRVDDWAILVLASDDMVPVVRGYDRRIVAAMDKHFPLRDGALNFHDGYNRDHVRPGDPVLCTLPVLGRHLYDAFGYVYYPEYGSIYVDNEQTKLLTSMNRMVFVDELIIEHNHHAAGKAPCDTLYQFNDGKYGKADRALFELRAKQQCQDSQFFFNAPPMVLSILVCSTHLRAENLRRLEEHLRPQMAEYPRQVELCADIDGGEVTVGEKRQRLLQRAVGKYVAFIDDDDLVDSRYVERILSALTETSPDCCSLEGVITTNGADAQRFTHSLGHGPIWHTTKGVHYRGPNHLNAIRRDLALQVGFVAKNVGEDHQFARDIFPLLKTEVSTGPAPLYYYFSRPQASVQRTK